MPAHTIKEKTTELKAKAKSPMFWLKGLIDSLIIGAATAITGSLGLEYVAEINMTPKAVAILAMTGGLTNALKYWIAHPLTSIE